MPRCVVEGCSNYSNRGFQVFPFPKDPSLKAKWITNCGVESWRVTPRSRICEVHFEDRDFQGITEEGTWKLKPNAVPSLFDIPYKVSRIESEIERSVESIMEGDEPVAIISIEDPAFQQIQGTLAQAEEATAQQGTFVHVGDAATLQHSTSSQPSDVHLQADTTEVALSQAHGTPQGDSSNVEEPIQYVDNCNKCQLLRSKNDWLLQEKERLQLENDRLTARVKEFETNLSGIFTKDQIGALALTKTVPVKWADKTVRNSVYLRYVIGHQGYNELRDLGYPLPSHEFLDRRLEKEFSIARQYRA